MYFTLFSLSLFFLLAFIIDLLSWLVRCGTQWPRAYVLIQQQTPRIKLHNKQSNRQSNVNVKHLLNMSVVALKRYDYSEMILNRKLEIFGKRFIIILMSVHKYLAVACMTICYCTIMCSDKETGFRSLMALMGLRRLSFILSHFILCQGKY
ncbi:unnamed protein product [Trichobilharzia regenti]|nr:unnamed protein product [Trichobilharzia regenti]